MSDLETRVISSPVAPKGIGGWLLLFALTMILIGPATHIMVSLHSYRHTIEVFARVTHPYSHYLFYIVEQLAGLALYGYSVFAGIQLWKTRPGALRQVKRFLLLLVLYHLVDLAVAVNFAWILGPTGTVGRYLSHALLRQLRILIYPAFWYSYLLKSKRVRNTFFGDEAASNSNLALL